MKRTEWHHTSKMYNKTDYYDLDAALEEASEEGRDLAAEIIEASKRKPVMYQANVEYLEWSGSRKHPHAEKCEHKNITVEEKGNWYVFHLPDGITKRKQQDSAGTYVFHLA